MTRVARIVMPERPHHITQRGNNRQDVFFVPDDYEAYLEILRQQSERYGLDVHAYCLMTNHIHLVATPQGGDSLAKAIGRTHWIYARLVNRLHGRSGHLWQNRFYSCALDRDHLWRAIAYVERNPVRARLHRKAWLYPWSSAAAHCGQRERPATAKTGTATPLAVPAFARAQEPQKTAQAAACESRLSATDATGLLDLRRWRKMMDADEWRAELTRAEDPATLAQLRTQTGRGRPLGSDSFLSKVEKFVGRRVRPLPVGRPKKERRKR